MMIVARISSLPMKILRDLVPKNGLGLASLDTQKMHRGLARMMIIPNLVLVPESDKVNRTLL